MQVIENSVKSPILAASEKTAIALSEKLANAKELIEKNIERNYSLKELSTSIFISESHFSRLFKKNFGIAPHQYMIRVKVQAGASLLQTTDRKIGDIALHAGFNDIFSFNRAFKSVLQTSPRAYRKAHHT